VDPEGLCRHPRDVVWTDRIDVPFSVETRASGIGRTGFFRSCWYRTTRELPDDAAGEIWLLHFGAVDYCADVWVNGISAGKHEGGYTPFTFDITDMVDSGPCEVVVCAEDDPLDVAKPRGKQDWQLEPHSIWYPRTTGIWQTVWIERVPAVSIARLHFTPDLTRWEIGLQAWIAGNHEADLRLAVKLAAGSTVIAADTYQVINGELHRGIALSDPGVDDSRNDLLWSPHAPNLIDVTLQLWAERGDLLDEVRSYTALRSVRAQGDRLLLNGRPYILRMVLDQGYWPESGLTAPDDGALKQDVELVRAMGFNGVRKHQKIEDPRYLFWADTIGLIVWEEMPSAYRFTEASVRRLGSEWTAVIQRDYSHPCIIAWVPINESWGVPNLPESLRERNYVQALYHLTKTLDPTRPVIGNDGWESVATDIVGIHDYDDRPDRMAKRYHADEVLPRLFKRERPGGRLLVLDGHSQVDVPIMLTEFGGLALEEPDGRSWGHVMCADPEAFRRHYVRLLKVVRNLALLSGFCYTQFADTYQEADGLLYADRTPKIPLAEIARATAGSVSRRSDGIEQLGSTEHEAI
jgi:beta-galactosidase/beta-glucuronidase